MNRIAEIPNRTLLERIPAVASPRAAAAAKTALPIVGMALIAALVGRQIALNEQMALLLVAAVLGAFAMTLPAGVWVIGALIAAIAVRGLVELGVPSIFGFFDFPLVWGALVSAVFRKRQWSPLARRHMRLLVGLGFAVVLAWLFHRSEAVRPVLYFALIAEPFALIGALLIDPPSPRLRRALALTAAALVAVQLPIAFWQAHHFGLGDEVKGTLYGAGAGAHVMAGFVALAALWVLAARHRNLLLRLLALGLLLAVPLVAQAKQVLFVLPLGVLVMPWSTQGRKAWILRAAVAAVGLLALFYLRPFTNEARSTDHFLREAGSGRTGKFAVGRLIAKTLKEDPATFLFGRGPAETVSRAAFMTTPLLLKEDSPLKMFNLKPAAIAVQAEAEANVLTLTNVPGHGTSFNSGQTSALGVLGDLGVVGMLLYASLLGSVLLAVRRARSPEASAAVAGWAMFAILGFIFDWWEQPPFTLFLAALTGIAFARSSATNPRGWNRPRRLLFGSTAQGRKPESTAKSPVTRPDLMHLS